MTLSDFENYVSYKIWSRGEEYFECNAVADLVETTPGEWSAIVKGTEDYNIEISLEENEIITWYCDCPYDGEICKHVVAVILAIRSNQSKQRHFLSVHKTKLMEQALSVPKDTRLEDILSSISSKQLSDFILKYASKHKECKQALINEFLPKSTKANESNKDYRYKIQQCFNSSYIETRNRYSGYYEPEIDWNKVSCDLNGYLKEANLLSKQHCFDGAITIATGILQAIGENYIEEELIYNDLFDAGFYCENAGEILLNIVQHPESTDLQKKAILNEVKRIEKYSTYREYDIYNIELLLDQILIVTQTEEEALEYVNQLIEERKSSWELYKLIEKKIRFLHSLQREDEVQATIKTYLYLPEIRKQIVQRLVASQQYDLAIQMLDEGIHIARKNHHFGTVLDWQKQKLSIYEKINNTANIIDMCRKLFISENGNLTYYRKLKKLIEATEWKTFLNKLIEQTKFIEYNWGGQCNEANIYLEENDHENLLKFLSNKCNHSLDVLMYYAHYLDSTHTNEIMRLLTKQIKWYAENNMGRNHYEYIAKILKEMKKLKDGKKTVKDIIEEFRVTYKRRPAMIETLNRL